MVFAGWMLVVVFGGGGSLPWWRRRASLSISASTPPLDFTTPSSFSPYIHTFQTRVGVGGDLQLAVESYREETPIHTFYDNW